MVEFSLDIIKQEKDKAVIQEIIALFSEKHYRATYVMAWLACIENLRSKIQSAANQSSLAKRGWEQIQNLEKAKTSADRQILSDAKTLHFISDIEYDKLMNFYAQRCIFAHPYNQEPSKIESALAIEYAINFSLAKSIKLGDEYVDEIINVLTTESALINNESDSVRKYAHEMLEILANESYGYFIDKYLAWLNSVPSIEKYGSLFNRGMLITKIVLKNSALSKTQLNRFISQYKNITCEMFGDKEIFDKMPNSIRDYIFNLMIENESSAISWINQLYETKLLNDKQIKEYVKLINNTEIYLLIYNKPNILLAYDKIIKCLKSHDFHQQNPAISLLNTYSKEELKTLSTEQQIMIGRNILQSSGRSDSYNSASAESLLSKVAQDITLLPNDIIRGIILECFTNNDYVIRLKLDRIAEVTKLFPKLPKSEQTSILSAIKNEIFTNNINHIRTGNYNELNGIVSFQEIHDLLKERVKN